MPKVGATEDEAVAAEAAETKKVIAKPAAAVGTDKERPGWLIKLCNMGGYCHSCGFDPVRKGHCSKSCKKKKSGHVDGTAINDRKGGSVENKPADFSL